MIRSSRLRLAGETVNDIPVSIHNSRTKPNERESEIKTLLS